MRIVSKQAVETSSRKLEREIVSEVDGIYLSAVVDGAPSQFKVVDFNCFGAKVESTLGDRMSEFNLKELKDVEIHYGNTVIGRYDEADIVHKDPDQRKKVVVGLRFLPAKGGENEKEDRLLERLILNGDYAPYAKGAHPYKFGEYLHFDLLDISAKGAKLATSVRNRTLLEGAEITDFDIFVPSLGVVKTKCLIKGLALDASSQRLLVNAEFVGVSRDFHENFVKYMLSFGGKDSTVRLRNAGFKIKKVKSHLSYEVVSDLSDYQRVLELRKEAYARSGKVNEDVGRSQMSDIFDINSLIVVAKSGDNVIGTVRVTYCRTQQDKFELESSIPLPSFLKRESTVESSRLSVAEGFTGTDAVHGLIEKCVELSLKLGATHYITSCTEEMLGWYQKIGFHRYGEPFELQAIPGVKHYFIYNDTRSFSTSHSLNPLYWQFTYKGVAASLFKFGFVDRFGLTRSKTIQLQVSSLLFGLATFVKRKFKKKSSR